MLAVLRDGALARRLDAGQEGLIVLDRTPFYANAGGQVGDRGVLASDGSAAEVTDTTSPLPRLHVHHVRVTHGAFERGMVVSAEVDAERRAGTMRHHTGTHLLHAALRETLGPHVKQAGSLVAPDRLRFDFSHYAAVTPSELRQIENRVNGEILRDARVEKKEMGREEALAYGALAFFGDKYGERVRVVEVPGFSKEFCGGTHVDGTGEIGLFLLTSEQGISAGTRRIEAVTGEAAVLRAQQDQGILEQLESAARVDRRELVDEYARLREQLKARERELTALKMKLATSGAAERRRHRAGPARGSRDAPLDPAFRRARQKGARGRGRRVPQPEQGPRIRAGVDLDLGRRRERDRGRLLVADVLDQGSRADEAARAARRRPARLRAGRRRRAGRPRRAAREGAGSPALPRGGRCPCVAVAGCSPRRPTLAPASLPAQVYTRLSANGVVEATNVPDSASYHLTYPGKGTLIHSRGFRRAVSGQFDVHVEAAAAQHQVSSDLVKAVIAVESEFDQWAVSSKGARGLMQLMPATARRFGVSDPFDARANIFAGTQYLRILLDSSQETSRSRWPRTMPARTPCCATGESRRTARRAATSPRCSRSWAASSPPLPPGPPRARPRPSSRRRSRCALRRSRSVTGTRSRRLQPMRPKTYYRWRDEGGMTHVAEAPPPEGMVYQTVRALD